jgi:hypothetical protein
MTEAQHTTKLIELVKLAAAGFGESAQELRCLGQAIAETRADISKRLATPPPSILSARKRKPKPVRTPDDLLTKHEAAARLRCSEKTIDAHAASGALRYVLIGRGSKRKRKMFAPADLAAFIEAQTQKDLPCPSSVTRVRGSTGSISGSQVIAFSARPKPRPGGKRKP